MSSTAEMKQFEVEVLELESAIRQIGLNSKRTARASVLTAVSILAIVVAFTLVNYSRVSAEMTEEKFARSLTKEMGEIAPLVLNEMNRLGRDLLPVYAEELKSQIESSWPEISARVEQELNEVGSRVFEETHELLYETEERILRTAEDELFACYPGLKDPERRDNLQERLHNICEQTLANSIYNFEQQFTKDVHRLQATVFQFDVADADQSTADLQKQFVHLWLQLLDQEVMEL